MVQVLCNRIYVIIVMAHLSLLLTVLLIYNGTVTNNHLYFIVYLLLQLQCKYDSYTLIHVQLHAAKRLAL